MGQRPEVDGVIDGWRNVRCAQASSGGVASVAANTGERLALDRRMHRLDAVRHPLTVERTVAVHAATTGHSDLRGRRLRAGAEEQRHPRELPHCSAKLRTRSLA